MAYLHCDSCDSCDWSQDDFWTWSYNPWRWFFCTALREDIRPRFYKVDPPMGERGLRRKHTWIQLAKEFWRMIVRPFTQKYWTFSSWKRAVAKNGGTWPTCPECGQHTLDID